MHSKTIPFILHIYVELQSRIRRLIEIHSCVLFETRVKCVKQCRSHVNFSVLRRSLFRNKLIIYILLWFCLTIILSSSKCHKRCKEVHNTCICKACPTFSEKLGSQQSTMVSSLAKMSSLWSPL